MGLLFDTHYSFAIIGELGIFGGEKVHFWVEFAL
jgi:hypothetical protein